MLLTLADIILTELIKRIALVPAELRSVLTTPLGPLFGLK